MELAPMPLARASPANCCFQPSYPAAELPHCAAWACGVSDADMAKAAKVAVKNLLRSVISGNFPCDGAPPGNSLAEQGPRSRPFKYLRFDSGALFGDKPAMAKKPGTNPKGEFAFFDVVYEDGSQRSNRRVPAELLGGLDGDEPARAFIMEQDREIAEKSGRPALEIKNLERVGAKKK